MSPRSGLDCNRVRPRVMPRRSHPAPHNNTVCLRPAVSRPGTGRTTASVVDAGAALAPGPGFTKESELASG